MRLNCKEGDLAVIVRSEFPENVGKVVEVICRFEHEHLDRSRWYWHVRTAGQDLWAARLKRPTLRLFGLTLWVGGWHADTVERTQHMSCLDERLRPLRDEPGEDEILRLAGTPQEREQHLVHALGGSS